MEQYNYEDSLLRQIEKNSRRQARYALAQCVFSFVSLVCCAGVLLLILGLMPRLESLVDQADAALQDLGTITQQLAALDYASLTGDMGQLLDSVDALIQNADTLITASQGGMEETLTKINSIDFLALNDAIQDLSDVIQPLARFFNSMGG